MCIADTEILRKDLTIDQQMGLSLDKKMFHFFLISREKKNSNKQTFSWA